MVRSEIGVLFEFVHFAFVVLSPGKSPVGASAACDL
jgi:hypothetical protein